MTSRAYRVHGLHCAEEVAAIRHALRDVPGIGDLHFDVLAERMVVVSDGAAVDDGQVAAAAARLGMRAEPWRPGPAVSRRSLARWLAMTSAVCLLAGLAVHVAESDSVWHALAESRDADGVHPVSATLFGLAAIAGLATTAPRAWRAIASGRLDMHVLVVVSVAGAVALGEWSEGATVAALFAAANLLESWSVARARQAVGALMHLAPPHASLVHHGHEHSVPVERLAIGDIIRVRPGDRVPVDGVVVSGLSSIDESALSGESVPVVRGEGDVVHAGTLNGTGSLDIRVQRTVGDSAVSRMAAAVDAARLRRTRAELWIERFAARYTPVVLAAATLLMVVPPLLGLGSWSEWIYRGLVVTLIACPCALVISTPVTIVAALAAAARGGVLVKGGETFEALARVRAVAYDKTGVVTRGDHRVEVVEALAGHGEAEVLSRLRAIESRSEHPLARAIVRFAMARGVPEASATAVRALPGRGAEGTVDGQLFWIGSHRLARERHALDPAIDARATDLEQRGLTVVLCGDAAGAWALVGLVDSTRDEVRDAVAAFTALGVRHQVVLTGDHEAAARVVVGTLGPVEVRAGLLPDDKERAVRELREVHGAVAMIGDGINDTPAMAAADVAVALRAGSTDAALEVADVVLVGNDLRRVPWAVAHARRALAVVKQNVWFAMSAKAAFVLAAAAGHATLWMAVAADTGATVIVTLSGLRLLRTTVVPPRAAALSTPTVAPPPATVHRDVMTTR